MSLPRLSVVIPTYNRAQILRRTLDSLARQTLPPAEFEVVLVDDGSTGEPPFPAGEQFDFALKCVRPEGRRAVSPAGAEGSATDVRREAAASSGATPARNAGAQASRGQVLVFLDDDIRLRPEALAALAEACAAREQTVVLGTLVTPEAIKTSVFARLYAEAPVPAGDEPGGALVPFTACKTGLLAVRREDFFDLGMFQDPTGGWPNWDDVDFGYRAHQSGLSLWKSWRAVGEHYDYSLADPAAAVRRWQRAGRSAARLFRRYPAIASHMPMFADKAPIAWRRDAPPLVLRKLLRGAASARPVLALLERVGRFLEKRFPSEALLEPVYRWIIGGHIFSGYRMGSKELDVWQPR